MIKIKNGGNAGPKYATMTITKAVDMEAKLAIGFEIMESESGKGAGMILNLESVIKLNAELEKFIEANAKPVPISLFSGSL